MQLKDNVRLTMGDWQWNAALVGFINIVGKNNINFIDNDTIEFSPNILVGFENKFFDYLIKTYEETLSWYKIVSFKDFYYLHVQEHFDNFDLESLKFLNNYIGNVKKYLKSNSYKAAYELIKPEGNMLEIEKKLCKVKEPKNKEQFSENKAKIIYEVEKVIIILKKAIEYCESANGKRHIAAKNIIYTIVKNAWSGVSFLNRTPTEKDVYLDYKNYFVEPAIDYLKSDDSKYKYTCFSCNCKMKDMGNDMSFLTETGFDTARKSSHVWNFQNDIAICPICKLIYSCLPAGMTYAYGKGLYVNANVRLIDAIQINNKIKKEILTPEKGQMHLVYPALIKTLQEQKNETEKYELADIQVVRYENETYRFSMLSRKMQEIIVNSKNDLNNIIKATFEENNEVVRIYDTVIDRVFNSQNLFTLIHRMLYYKIANSSKCHFIGGQINNLLCINQRIYKSFGGLKMEKTLEQSEETFDLVKLANKAGYYLRKAYNDKGSDNKLPGICYRLLNALKTGNDEIFMDVILNCYLYINATVPKVITEVLGDDKGFSTMGYAFVAGLIDGKNSNENSGKNKGGETNEK